MQPLQRLDPRRFDAPEILKRLAAASRHLAELKGGASSIPNQGILIHSLGLQEAKDSSAIENIVTTHDELFRNAVSPGAAASVAAKEVAHYSQALHIGWQAVIQSRLLTNNTVLRVQQELEQNDAGYRRLPGTSLKTDAGVVVYTPPQAHADIVALMSALERFINDDDLFDADPLVKMALIHHQFESVHPFYDGNGRTGRIICVLYLVKTGLLDIPILYLSRHIVRTKSEYYRLLQDVRDKDAWEPWVVYLLHAVELTARQGIATVGAIKELLMGVKHRVRAAFPKLYSQDLINNLFRHPYTKIEFLQNDLGVTRLTASKYLDTLVAGGVLKKQKVGRSNYYINEPLVGILTAEGMRDGAPGL